MRIYILCHDKESERKADNLCEKWNNENDNFYASSFCLIPSPYMESSCYPYFLMENYEKDWSKHDYVGIVTYSILSKLEFFGKSTIKDINWSKIKKEDADIIGIMGINYKRIGSQWRLSLLEGYVFQHGLNFYKAWRELLRHMNYNEQEIDTYYYTSGIICNWWIAKPSYFKEYCLFIKSAISTINKNKELQDIFMLNSHYGDKNTTPEQKKELFGISDYYPLHPFIFERLLSFFFQNKKINIKFLHRIVMYV